MSASAKVMLSYDYCHFEICLNDDSMTEIGDVNKLRKTAQRLADEAVRQYKKAKEMAEKRESLDFEKGSLQYRVDEIMKTPKSERTPEQTAMVKTLADENHWSQYNYDYEDDFEL